MPEFLDIIPFQKNSKVSVDVPGSKSISNRALILAVLNKGTITLSGILKSDDVNIMISALQELGVNISERDNGDITVHGTEGKLFVRKAKIHVGNAGTVARFLTALLSLQDDAEYFLDGTEAMRKRPMDGLIKALELHGTEFEYSGKQGHFPFRMKCNGLNSTDWIIDASLSSQILSAILLIAPCISGNKSIELVGKTVSKPFVEMTLNMMKQFSSKSGSLISSNNSSYTIGNFSYNFGSSTYQIEPDATASSYFLSLPIAVNGSVRVRNVDKCILQGDINYCEILKKCGVKITTSSSGFTATVDSSIRGGEFDFNDISDTFLTLAALSPILDSPLRISGIAHTRNQETDRVSGMVSQLRKIVQDVEETEDSIFITPNLNLNKYNMDQPVEIETYEDHRFAMSFAILGCYNFLKNHKPWIRIIDPHCCRKTFPTFFDKLQECRMNKG